MADRDDDTPLTEDQLARRGAALIADAMIHREAQAPHALREALDRQASNAQAPRRRWRPLPSIAAAGALATLLAIVVVAGVGHHDGPSGAPSLQLVRETARLPSTAPPPAPVLADHDKPRLRLAVQGLPFPDWRKAYGWRASGSRQDHVRGRDVSTVRYRYRDGTTLVYAIVAGRALRPAAGGDVVVARTRYRTSSNGGRTTVTWIQAGHTCLIDAPSSVSASELLRLADSNQTQ